MSAAARPPVVRNARSGPRVSYMASSHGASLASLSFVRSALPAAAAWLFPPARGPRVLLETWLPQQRALRRTAMNETAISGSGPTANGVGAGRGLAGPKTRRRNDQEAGALCRIGGVRDRAARNLVSARTHRRWSQGARHRRKAGDTALDTAPNKTDANAADRLSLLGPGRFLPGGSRQKLCGDTGAASGGFGLDAAASMPIHARAHPNNPKRLLTKASR